MHKNSDTTHETSQVWTTCPYVSKDGQFNPDGRVVNNVGDFDSLANAVLYNSLAWALQGYSVYSSRVVTFIKAWFLDADTYMNPNLNYAQMQRGPDGQVGTHTGILYVAVPFIIQEGRSDLARLFQRPEVHGENCQWRSCSASRQGCRMDLRRRLSVQRLDHQIH